jgi:hypothetical protein
MPPRQPVLQTASLTPTVPGDDDGNIEPESPDRDGDDVDVEMDSDDSGDIDPFYAVCINIEHEDIRSLCEEATEMGVYTAVMQGPVKFNNIETESAGANSSSMEGSQWLLVASRNPELVKLVVDSQEYRMPAAMEDPPMNTSQVKSVTNLQLIFTGFVGGFIAVCMLSLLRV